MDSNGRVILDDRCDLDVALVDAERGGNVPEEAALETWVLPDMLKGRVEANNHACLLHVVGPQFIIGF